MAIRLLLMVTRIESLLSKVFLLVRYELVNNIA
jgi:hypothetical protein